MVPAALVVSPCWAMAVVPAALVASPCWAMLGQVGQGPRQVSWSKAPTVTRQDNIDVLFTNIDVLMW